MNEDDMKNFKDLSMVIKSSLAPVRDLNMQIREIAEKMSTLNLKINIPQETIDSINTALKIDTSALQQLFKTTRFQLSDELRSKLLHSFIIQSPIDKDFTRKLNMQFAVLKTLIPYIPETIKKPIDEPEETVDIQESTLRAEFDVVLSNMETRISNLEQKQETQEPQQQSINWQLYLEMMIVIIELIKVVIETFNANPPEPVTIQQMNVEVNQIFINHGYDIEDIPIRIEDGNDMSGGEES